MGPSYHLRGLGKIRGPSDTPTRGRAVPVGMATRALGRGRVRDPRDAGWHCTLPSPAGSSPPSPPPHTSSFQGNEDTPIWGAHAHPRLVKGLLRSEGPEQPTAAHPPFPRFHLPVPRWALRGRPRSRGPRTHCRAVILGVSACESHISWVLVPEGPVLTPPMPARPQLGGTGTRGDGPDKPGRWDPLWDSLTRRARPQNGRDGRPRSRVQMGLTLEAHREQARARAWMRVSDRHSCHVHLPPTAPHFSGGTGACGAGLGEPAITSQGLSARLRAP